jgi:hypothetical protein
MDSSLLSGEKKVAQVNLAIDAHGRKGTSKNAGAYYKGITDDRSSVMTDKSFFIAACKLRAKPAQRVTLYCLRPVFRGALETNSQPTGCAKPPVS